ncbi:MlaE family ABC transporter permease [Capnocytophaga canimorsus]|nr:ABC transporter permease [Capnocytophaga canimorsus]ATA76667.1 ABC transporter permease [Capnocytophaga canimorsus]ATA93390.1 ABC transporter permease [Capnocytophaga canimorsus]AWL78129.1 ABC transporter permease [Capnocytophaga canimorsus]AYW36765.1 ABC transporter permease [Capnocytophaga canimorsus]MDT9499447.1 ABC transporter permease [Capnocytophaga canimorsus]
MKHIAAIGRYFIMLYDIFRKRTRWGITKNLILKDIDDLIFNSIGIIAFISFFIGGVVAVQTALNIDNPFIPKYLIGFATRQSIILEFAPTFTSIILAGKVGSFITSSIGTMRVTEQIDALDIMGVNSLNYLVFPKIVALMLFPFLVAMAMYLGIFGGWTAVVMSGYATSSEFIEGVKIDFKTYTLIYAFTKSVIFAFLLATIPAYHGYYMKGGALDVGKASTVSFVWTSIAIIIANSVITQLFYA